MKNYGFRFLHSMINDQFSKTSSSPFFKQPNNLINFAIMSDSSDMTIVTMLKDIQRLLYMFHISVLNMMCLKQYI